MIFAREINNKFYLKFVKSVAIIDIMLYNEYSYIILERKAILCRNLIGIIQEEAEEMTDLN